MSLVEPVRLTLTELVRAHYACPPLDWRHTGCHWQVALWNHLNRIPVAPTDGPPIETSVRQLTFRLGDGPNGPEWNLETPIQLVTAAEL